MENYKKMIKRHNKEIKDLQNNCKHKKVSDWVDFMGAPAHVSHQVRVCEFCDKEMYKKRSITIPSTVTLDLEGKIE